VRRDAAARSLVVELRLGEQPPAALLVGFTAGSQAFVWAAALNRIIRSG